MPDHVNMGPNPSAFIFYSLLNNIVGRCESIIICSLNCATSLNIFIYKYLLATISSTHVSEMMAEGRSLAQGLQKMGTMTGIARQIADCLAEAHIRSTDALRPQIMLHLDRTIDTLVIGRLLKKTRIPDDLGATIMILVEGPPDQPSWQDWFIFTQRHICQRF